MSHPTPVLELNQVTKVYPGSPPVEALRDVTLEIAAGELVTIVGPSGSGKSTLLNIVGTLDRVTSGNILIEGHDVARFSDRALAGMRSARIGFVFQQFHLLEGMSALDNVAAGLLYQGARRSRRRSESATALERVGLGHRMRQRPGKLSGGERQRVAIARALVGDPAIVLADEPTGNLDSQTSREILSLLMELNRDGSTIIVITHDKDIADQLPRQIGIRDGMVEFDSSKPVAAATVSLSGTGGIQ